MMSRWAVCCCWAMEAHGKDALFAEASLVLSSRDGSRVCISFCFCSQLPQTIHCTNVHLHVLIITIRPRSTATAISVAVSCACCITGTRSSSCPCATTWRPQHVFHCC